MGLRGPAPTKSAGQMICTTCGIMFLAGRHQKEESCTCSRECRYSKSRYSNRTVSCRQCGTKIEGASRATKYCSDECQSIYNAANPKLRPRTCVGCGDGFNASFKKQIYCSNPCKAKWARKKALGEVCCKTCNNTFTPTPDTYMDYCSDDCKRAAKRADWVRNNVKRQSIMTAVPIKHRINTAEIFARANNICQICGILTKREGGKYSPDYPTIDHIIPISKGGQHIASNLQCACLRCNMSKGAKVSA